MFKHIFKFITLLIKIAVSFMAFLLLLGSWTTGVTDFISCIIILVVLYIIYRAIKKLISWIIFRIKGDEKSSQHNDLDEFEQTDLIADTSQKPKGNPPLEIKKEEKSVAAKSKVLVQTSTLHEAILTSAIIEKELPETPRNDVETSFEPVVDPISTSEQECISEQEIPSVLKLDTNPKISRHVSITDADSLLKESGCLAIEKGKASIGLIQRQFKIGFNRATHIMDQLEEIGLVGPENDTKPRTILMTEKEFLEQLEYVEYIESEHIPNSQPIADEDIKNKVSAPLMARIEVEHIINGEINYSKDGESLSKLQNSIIPCATDNDKITIINTLIKFNSWDKLKLIMIDRTGIDFLQYHLLPHLFIPIVTDDAKFQGVFDWVYYEMQGRIEKFLPLYARDIFSYNSKADMDSQLPVLVIIVSELFGLNTEFFQHFTELLLNSARMGIYFIGFSKMECKSLSLGINQSLLEIKTVSQFLNLLMDIHLPDKNYTDFDQMNGIEFEQFCADLLRKNDFQNVQTTKDTGDQGIDIIAQKDSIQYGIQCKCYTSDIGNKAVQEAFAGKTYYGCHVAMVLTNRYFTKSAKELAATNKVILWDRSKLESLIASAKF